MFDTNAYKLIAILYTVVLVLCAVFFAAQVQSIPEQPFATRITYYNHFQIIESSARVLEIDVDDTLAEIGCDAYTENDEGQTCVLAGDDTITEFLFAQGLLGEYHV